MGYDCESDAQPHPELIRVRSERAKSPRRELKNCEQNAEARRVRSGERSEGTTRKQSESEADCDELNDRNQRSKQRTRNTESMTDLKQARSTECD